MCISKIVLDHRAGTVYNRRDLDRRMMLYVNGVAT